MLLLNTPARPKVLSTQNKRPEIERFPALVTPEGLEPSTH